MSWEAVGDGKHRPKRNTDSRETEISGSVVQGRAENAKISEKPTQILIIIQIINTIRYLLIVLLMNISYCVY